MFGFYFELVTALFTPSLSLGGSKSQSEKANKGAEADWAANKHTMAGWSGKPTWAVAVA